MNDLVSAGIAALLFLSTETNDQQAKSTDNTQMVYLTSEKNSVYHLLGRVAPDGNSFIDCRGEKINLVPRQDFKIERTNASCITQKGFKSKKKN